MIPETEQGGVGKTDSIDELEGEMSKSSSGDKLMRSVMESDKQTLDEAKAVNESINNSMGSFAPDLMFEKMVSQYSTTKKIIGDSIVRALTGYDPNYVEKNIKIPEFQREVKNKIREKVREMKQKGLLDKDNMVTDTGVRLASLALYMEEIDNLTSHGMLGEKLNKEHSIYGGKTGVRGYRKHDRYRDLALKRSIKAALRRGHTDLRKEDLKTFERQAKGSKYLMYALDASGSMKGNKIATAKKAGVALAFKAIDENDHVGLLVFGKKVTKAIAPTLDFEYLLRAITTVRASSETNFQETIEKAIELFPSVDATKHLVLLTDALPTAGSDPTQETLDAISKARRAGITVSLVGINLDESGEELARKIVAIGEGRMYSANEGDQLDQIVLQDYYSL